jgi:hypothetical protein
MHGFQYLQQGSKSQVPGIELIMKFTGPSNQILGGFETVSAG